jgi:hypothetical protein
MIYMLLSEEHHILVQEPETRYIGHITPASGEARSVKDALIYYFDKNIILWNH